MKKMKELLDSIPPLDGAAMRRAEQRWDSVAKPLRSLGLLEDLIVRIAGVTRSDQVDLSKRAVVVMCADNGVVAQGVTQTSQEVTAVVARNLTLGRASVNKMAAVAGADVFPVDLGIAADVDAPGLHVHKIAYGTKDISLGPAMTRAQAAEAMEYGAELVRRFKEDGYRLLATGEMGIGNTTTSSALVSVFLNLPAREVTGRGAGLTREGLRRKVEAIERAVAINRPDPADGLDVLSKLGGFDIAGMAGVFIGGAVYGVPVLIDGFISLAAALAAQRIAPPVREYLLASHLSDEPAAGMVMGELGLCPPIACGMRLGEGTGAVAAIPLLDMALAVYKEMSTFDDIGIEAYQPL